MRSCWVMTMRTSQSMKFIQRAGQWNCVYWVRFCLYKSLRRGLHLQLVRSERSNGMLWRRFCWKTLNSKKLHFHHHPFMRNFTLEMEDATKVMGILAGRTTVLCFGYKHVSDLWEDHHDIDWILASGKTTEKNRRGRFQYHPVPPSALERFWSINNGCLHPLRGMEERSEEFIAEGSMRKGMGSGLAL